MRKIVFRVSASINATRLHEVVAAAIVQRNTGTVVDSFTDEPPVDIGSTFEVTFPVEVSALDVSNLLQSIAAVPVTVAVAQFDEVLSTKRDLEEKEKGTVELAPWETAKDVKDKLKKVNGKVA